MSSLMVAVRVTPGSRRPYVGGSWNEDAAPPRLKVAVAAPAQDGKANKAVAEAVATAVGIKRAQAKVVHGLTSRSKTVELDLAAAELRTVQDRLHELLANTRT